MNAEFEYAQKTRELSKKKQHLKYLQSVDHQMKDMKKLSDDMDTTINAAIAAGTSVDDAVQPLLEKMADMTKNINLLLHPQAKTAPAGSDKSEEVKKILSRKDIDESTKIALVNTLLGIAA